SSVRSAKEIVIDEYEFYSFAPQFGRTLLKSYKLDEHSGYEHLTSGIVSVRFDLGDYARNTSHQITFNSGGASKTVRGMPVLSFSTQKYVNGNVNGLLSNYSVVTESTYQGGVAQ